MPASSLAQILLRLYSLNLTIYGTIQLFILLFNWFGFGLLSIYEIGVPIIYLVVGLVLWFFSPYLCKLAAGKNDDAIKLDGVSEFQLYSTAFLCLGLYFALGRMGEVLSWIHFFAAYNSPDYGFHREGDPSYYDLAEPAITVVIGIVLVVTARRWAAKLCRQSGNSEAKSK